MIRFLMVLFGAAPVALGAQSFSGRWQGTLETGTRQERLILDFASRSDGAMTAALYNLDQGGFASPSAAFSAHVGNGRVEAQFARGALSLVRAEVGGRLEGSWRLLRGAAQKVTFARPAASDAWLDSTRHSVRFVPLGGGVSLELLDFGGAGRPVVLLTGAGNYAHL